MFQSLKERKMKFFRFISHLSNILVMFIKKTTRIRVVPYFFSTSHAANLDLCSSESCLCAGICPLPF